MPSVKPIELGSAQARRIALAAQGFGRPGTPSVVPAAALLRTVRRLGVVQLDSVNVVSRSHYLPLYSRLGPYDRAMLDRLAWEPRTRSARGLFEYWGHEASLLPVEHQPLLRWRMERAADSAWGRMRRIAVERPDFVRLVIDAIRDLGPGTAQEISAYGIEAAPRRRSGTWWDWDDLKIALEWLFWSGALTTATRRSFQRVYDLPERVLPAAILAAPTPEPAVAQRELVRLAARATGVATERDLRDYFRLSVAEARLAVAALVEEGELAPVRVEGWRQAAYLHRDARMPRRIEARTLLSPFDNLIWERDRTERLFGFRYRIEIYVPQPKRIHGYYVLPLLLGDRLIARVDLKADRQAGVLLAPKVTLEPDAPDGTAAELTAELERLAGWLGLSSVAMSNARRS